MSKRKDQLLVLYLGLMLLPLVEDLIFRNLAVKDTCLLPYDLANSQSFLHC